MVPLQEFTAILNKRIRVFLPIMHGQLYCHGLSGKIWHTPNSVTSHHILVNFLGEKSAQGI